MKNLFSSKHHVSKEEYADLQERLTELSSQLEETKDAFGHAEQTRELLDDLYKEQMAETRQLRAALADSEARLESEAEAASRQEEHSSSRQATISEFESQQAAAEERYEGFIKERTSKISELETQQAAAEERCTGFTVKISELESQLADERERHKQIQAHLATEATKTAAEARTKLAESERTLAAMRAQTISESESTQSEISEMHCKTQALHARIEFLETEEHQLRESLKSRDEEFIDAKSSLDASATKLEHEAALIVSLKNEIREQQQGESMAAHTDHSINGKCVPHGKTDAEMQEEIRKLQQKFDNVSEENTALEEQLHEAQTQMRRPGSVSEEIRKLQQNFDKVSDDSLRLIEENTALEEQLHEAQTQMRRPGSATEEIRELQQQAHEESLRLSQANLALEDQIREYEDAKQEAASRVAALLDEHAAAQAESENLREQLAESLRLIDGSASKAELSAQYLGEFVQAEVETEALQKKLLEVQATASSSEALAKEAETEAARASEITEELRIELRDAHEGAADASLLHRQELDEVEASAQQNAEQVEELQEQLDREGAGHSAAAADALTLRSEVSRAEAEVEDLAREREQLAMERDRVSEQLEQSQKAQAHGGIDPHHASNLSQEELDELQDLREKLDDTEDSLQVARHTNTYLDEKCTAEIQELKGKETELRDRLRDAEETASQMSERFHDQVVETNELRDALTDSELAHEQQKHAAAQLPEATKAPSADIAELEGSLVDHLRAELAHERQECAAAKLAEATKVPSADIEELEDLKMQVELYEDTFAGGEGQKPPGLEEALQLRGECSRLEAQLRHATAARQMHLAENATAAADLKTMQSRCICGNTFAEDATFCRKCGRPRYCSCGTAFTSDSAFCRKCGEARADANGRRPHAPRETAHFGNFEGSSSALRAASGGETAPTPSFGILNTINEDEADRFQPAARRPPRSPETLFTPGDPNFWDQGSKSGHPDPSGANPFSPAGSDPSGGNPFSTDVSDAAGGNPFSADASDSSPLNPFSKDSSPSGLNPFPDIESPLTSPHLGANPFAIESSSSPDADPGQESLAELAQMREALRREENACREARAAVDMARGTQTQEMQLRTELCEEVARSRRFCEHAIRAEQSRRLLYQELMSEGERGSGSEDNDLIELSKVIGRAARAIKQVTDAAPKMRPPPVEPASSSSSPARPRENLRRVDSLWVNTGNSPGDGTATAAASHSPSNLEVRRSTSDASAAALAAAASCSSGQSEVRSSPDSTQQSPSVAMPEDGPVPDGRPDGKKPRSPVAGLFGTSLKMPSMSFNLRSPRTSPRGATTSPKGITANEADDLR